MLKVRSPLTEAEEQIVSRVIGCGIEVHRVLGPGFKEPIYARAFSLELDASGLKFESEKPIEVRYKQWSIPGQRLDLIVEGIVIVELKAVPKVKALHRRQVVSYLRSTGLKVGLIMNFNVKVLKDGLARVVRDPPK
jgi:GxxExxY protein